MKKLLLSVIFLFTLVGVKATNEPTLLLEVHYKSESDITKLNAFTSDTNFCCIFDINAVETKDTSYTKIIHKPTGVVLGTFYGTPTKEFIMIVYQNQLTPDYVNEIVPKLIAMEKRK